jgi:Zn-finger nucleic acid-binding protein
MKCPDCAQKLTQSNYDEGYEWYECPNCEGCFTADEILEGMIEDESDESEDRRQQGDRSRSKGAKAGRGRGSQREDARGADKGVQEALGNSRAVAKGKKRRTQIQEDDEVIAEFEKSVLTPVKAQSAARHRDEVPSLSVVNIWGDEIQDVYNEMGMELDAANAQDKALIIWREIHLMHGVTAREQETPHALCEEHE